MECEERKGALRLKRTVARQGRGLFPRADKRLHALFKQRRGRKLKVSAFFLCINARALVMEEYGESPNPWLKKMAAKFTASRGWRERWSSRFRVVPRKRTNKKVTPIAVRHMKRMRYLRGLKRFVAKQVSDEELAASRGFISAVLARPFGLTVSAATGGVDSMHQGGTGMQVLQMAADSNAAAGKTAKVGDELVMVEGTVVRDMAFDAVASLLSGPGGSRVALVFWRKPSAAVEAAAGVPEVGVPGATAGVLGATTGAPGATADAPGAGPAEEGGTEVGTAECAPEEGPAEEGGTEEGESEESDSDSEKDDKDDEEVEFEDFENNEEEEGQDEDADEDEENAAVELPWSSVGCEHEVVDVPKAPSARGLIGKTTAFFEEDCGWFVGTVVRQAHGSGGENYATKCAEADSAYIKTLGASLFHCGPGAPPTAQHGAWRLIKKKVTTELE